MRAGADFSGRKRGPAGPAPDVPARDAAARDAPARGAEPEHPQRTLDWRRELIVLLVGIVLGVVLAPIATFLVGSRVLGPYAGGPGLPALMASFLRGLAAGGLAYWVIALGPYLFLLLLRALAAALRRIKSPREPMPGEQAP